MDALRQEFTPRGTFLDTASHGLLPRRSVTAVRRGAALMAEGTLDQQACLRAVDGVRADYAALVGVTADRVAVGSSVAVHVALVAASLPAGAEVLLAAEEFSSLPTPFDQRGGLRLRQVPLDGLVDAVRPGTDLVAVSAAQSADGRVVDLGALLSAAREHGARTLLDTTQAAGWLPLGADRFDYTVCGGYKWLLTPRGVSFLSVPPGFGGLRPLHAGWVAGAEPWQSCYGPVAELAPDARRFDQSPAYLPYLGAAPSLRLLAEAGPARVGAHARALAARFREGLAGLGCEVPDAGGPIVSFPEPEGAVEALHRAGVRVARRRGALRAAFHLYNDEADVDRAIAALETTAAGR
ncbi:aminotransferase class V-fold PLP-dependent enzyme [Streptomyces spiramenti]|uniref:Aminotransferase class V-fold PLP-dependent enzyme n=1 Tax=Streptomyces spiramenti TaxID=2720606 RepID=A0ABX1AK61_9ACTN|nr:aminotransferase class V-fold PLP-dependent enzyme [Streptomyces spiramenti]NJP65773.1 aminotransferase class V-fold PLP-dependent enzyme [Streptomyces spiramenti]